jgi:hypothetical protein
MTTPRPHALVSLAATIAMTLTLGACAGAPAGAGLNDPSPAEATSLAIRFDNQARDFVHVYLVGQRREWLLGRVAPGATAALRIPEGALTDETGFVQLAVVTGGRVTQQAARDARAQLTIAQPAAMLASQRWRIAQGQLSSFALGGSRTHAVP